MEDIVFLPSALLPVCGRKTKAQERASQSSRRTRIKNNGFLQNRAHCLSSVSLHLVEEAGGEQAGHIDIDEVLAAA
jgi:hypothetical protein